MSKYEIWVQTGRHEGEYVGRAYESAAAAKIAARAFQKSRAAAGLFDIATYIEFSADCNDREGGLNSCRRFISVGPRDPWGAIY